MTKFTRYRQVTVFKTLKTEHKTKKNHCIHLKILNNGWQGKKTKMNKIGIKKTKQIYFHVSSLFNLNNAILCSNIEK